MGSRHIRGALVYNTHKIVLSGDYTVANESLIVVNKTVGAATAVTLPASVTADGRREVVVLDGKGDAGTNNITVTAAGSDTINGAATYVMAANYSRVRLIDIGGGAWIAAAGVELTSTQAAFLSSVTAGTGAASKALVLDSGGNVIMPSGGEFGLSRVAVAAAGTNQATAAVLAQQVNAVTGADGTVGVALPAAATTIGPIQVINTVATSPLFVYPVASGNDAINGLSANSALEMGPGEAAWFIPTSATQWYCSTPGNGRNVENVTATNVLTTVESGKTFFLNSATEFVSTLPAVASSAGCRYTFIVKAAPSGASYTIVTNSSENKILGNVVSSQDAGGSGDSEQTGGDTISFVDGQAVVGDRVDVVCDGAFWYATCVCKVVAGITITTAS